MAYYWFYALFYCIFFTLRKDRLGTFIINKLSFSKLLILLSFNQADTTICLLFGVTFTFFAMFYAILGGMNSIVWADLIQYIIMTISAIAVGIIAMTALNNADMLNVPEGWLNPGFGMQLNLDWTNIIAEVNDHIKNDGFSLFGIFMMMVLFKGILVSAAGPAPSYDMQKILSAKSAREASLMSGFVSVVLMPIRYFMVVGFAVLGLLYYEDLNLVVGNRLDFEQILPSAINAFVPVGLMGLLLAGLLAAFMSTFAGTLNAAQAYLINDIYLKYINPNASNKKTSHISYLLGILVVTISIGFGLIAENVNSILQWIVSALFGSYVVSNVIKWYWWRFNAHGYFWGMVAGLAGAMIIPVMLPQILELYLFPVFLVISLIGAIIGTYKYPATDTKVLVEFYTRVRPWGFWKPIERITISQNPEFKPNKNFKRDMGNITVGIVAQTCLVIIPFYLILGEYLSLAITIGITAVCAILLKKYWYDQLS